MKLVTEKISVNIAQKSIIKDINIEVLNNEFVGIIGPNGAGKSTFLKTIYRVLKPNDGVVYLGGKNINELSLKESARKMSVVAQLSNVSFDFSVKEMVLFGRSPYKKTMEKDTSLDNEIMLESIKKVGLLGFENRSYFTLSGGERQRVMLARAFAQQTDFMILDEPTNHLDIKHQLEFLNIIKKEKLTVLSAMHDLNLTAMFCDKVYAFKDGKLLYGGKTEDVLTEEIIFDLYGVKTKIVKRLDSKLHIEFLNLI